MPRTRKQVQVYTLLALRTGLTYAFCLPCIGSALRRSELPPPLEPVHVHTAAPARRGTTPSPEGGGGWPPAAYVPPTHFTTAQLHVTPGSRPNGSSSSTHADSNAVPQLLPKTPTCVPRP